MGKYDIIDKHYLESREVLADLIGAELHEQCVAFPPDVGDEMWGNAAFERRFRSALPGLPAPDGPMIQLLCRVLDLEIDHEIEDIDRLVKDGVIQTLCGTRPRVETFHFLWQILLHHLEARSMDMQVGFKRQDKHRVVDSLRKRGALVQLPPGGLH